jgi:hypothetical protein
MMFSWPGTRVCHPYDATEVDKIILGRTENFDLTSSISSLEAGVVVSNPSREMKR